MRGAGLLSGARPKAPAGGQLRRQPMRTLRTSYEIRPCEMKCFDAISRRSLRLDAVDLQYSCMSTLEP